MGVTVGASAHSLLRGQLAWFREQDWDVTLVTTPDAMAQHAAEREGVALVGIAMHRGISPGKDLIALGHWLRTLHRVRPDAINVGTPKAALLGILAAWALRVPRRLYVVRGLRLEGTAGPLAALLWVMERVTMTLATDVLFVSRSLADEANSRRLLPWRTSWLIGSGSSNGVDTEAVTARVAGVDRSELRRRLELDESDFVVGFVGRITRDKGVDTLLRAVREDGVSSRIRLLLIGELEEADLEAQIHALGARVVRLPWTDDVWGHLPAVDVLCLPTRREGFPNVVLEAAAVGIPTITTRATGAVDAVRHGQTGMLVDVDDATGLAARMNDLARDRDLTARLGRAARALAVEEFGPARIWTGLNEILEGATEPEHAVSLRSRDSEQP